MIQLLWRTVWKFLKKLKIELLYDPAIPLLGIYPGEELLKELFKAEILGSLSPFHWSALAILFFFIAE